MPCNFKKPPLGLKPRTIVCTERLKEIDEAIARYVEAQVVIPEEWIDERNDLLYWLNDFRSEKAKGGLVETNGSLSDKAAIEAFAISLTELQCRQICNVMARCIM